MIKEFPDMKSHPTSTYQPSENNSGPLPVWRIAFLLLCALGIYFSAELLRLHVKVYTDPNYHSFCAVSDRFNCETVATSKYAVFAGLPVALWGLAGYLFMAGLCLWGMVRQKQPPTTWLFGLLFWLSLISVLVSVVLFVVSHTEIQSLCLLCMATYAVNFLLFGLAILELRRLKSGPFKTLHMDTRAVSDRRLPFSLYFAFSIVLLVVVHVAMPAYWEVDITTGPGGLLIGKTDEGLDWIGARQPVLEIEEFSDYQCPYCSRGHQTVRSLVGQHPDQIRLVHRHYPLKSHKYAFAYAVMAHCAGKQERFWEANDYLYTNGRRKNPVRPEELAEAIGIDPEALKACMVSEESKSAILQDITAGRNLKLKGTPTYVIGDQTYPGSIPEDVIAEALRTTHKDQSTK
jgi:uncharacterized membrane protein/2-hydroxychromene-2-carboxylate isomerase